MRIRSAEVHRVSETGPPPHEGDSVHLIRGNFFRIVTSVPTPTYSNIGFILSEALN
jgi:hypothetical protein